MAIPIHSRRSGKGDGSGVETRDGGGGPCAPVLDAVRAAGDRLLERWDEHSTAWMAGREEAEEALGTIADEVERIRCGGEAPAPPEPPARPLLHHRLCEALRTELLVGRDSGSDPGAALSDGDRLDLLATLERYRMALWDEQQEEGDLPARLAEPDAFELVVEVAHDLRSPLNSILFLSEVLRSGHTGPVNEQQRSQLGLVYSASLEMLSMVSDVMDLASENKGVRDDGPEPFAIGSVFESVREMVGPMAEEKGVELKFRTPDYDQFSGHPDLLGRVLLNLTTNALKFTEEGSVTVEARVVARSRVEFSVTDTGRGMPDEERDRLFHAFRKATDRSGYFFSGSGLGLSICRRLVRAMDSELQVESEEGEGTRFSFQVELPRA